MLKETWIVYKDGTVKTEIISLKDGEVFSVNPRQDNIQHAGVRTFKYHVPQHRYLPKAIVRLGGKTYIYPEQIECHPDTTLDDIIVDVEETVTIEETTTLQTPEKKTWEFESSSGDGKYFVSLNKFGNPKCNCPGVWRAKDKRCKHIKEVEKELGLVK
jgi:hypothetical protein